MTAPLLLGLLLQLFKDSLFSTTTPSQNLSPTGRRHCDLGINIDIEPPMSNVFKAKMLTDIGTWWMLNNNEHSWVTI